MNLITADVTEVINTKRSDVGLIFIHNWNKLLYILYTCSYELMLIGVFDQIIKNVRIIALLSGIL